MRDRAHLLNRLLAEPDERVVEEDRLDRPDPLPLDLDRLLRREALARRLRLGKHRREALRAQVALIEELLRGLDHRGHDSGLADDAARGAHRAASGASRDLTDLERELRGSCERVAAPVHRRRPGMGGLPTPGDPVALDAERPEDDAERETEALEHRALLDVQLEVRGGGVELGACCERGVEIHAVRGQRGGERGALAVRQLAQLVLVGHRARGGARPEETAPEARPLLVGPVDEPDRDRRRAHLRRCGAAPPAPATTLRLPSSQPPFGTESMCPPMSTARSDSPRSVNHWFPAESIDSSAPVSETRPRSQARACSHVSVQATRCAPFSSPVSSRSSFSSASVRFGSSATQAA